LKTFRQKIIVTTFIFITLLLSGSYLINQYLSSKEEQHLLLHSKVIKTQYETTYKFFKIISQDIFDMYSSNKKLINLFKKAKDANTTQQQLIRDKLYIMLKKRYKRMKNMGVVQLHFHLPDNTSFLRLHKPEKFGDNLSSIRESVVRTNRYKLFSEGLESGKVSHGFRFVYPLSDENANHIGSVEISLSSEQLMLNIANDHIYSLHFLLPKKDITDKTWIDSQKEFYEDSVISNSLVMQKHQLWTNTKILNFYKNISKKNKQKIIQEFEKNKDFTISIKEKDKYIEITAIAIDYSGISEEKAFLVAFHKDIFFSNLDIEKKYILILFYSISILLFIFILLILKKNTELNHVAHYDMLTELPNRNLFYIELEKEIKRAKRNQTKVALLFMDIDGFKQVNDKYGHNIGDKLLHAIAQRVQKCIRGTDLVSRLGGDEFTVILSDISQEKETLDISKKIINVINEEFNIDSNIIYIGVSIGIALYPDHGEDIDALIQNSDDMMYKVKNANKNSAIVYNAENN